MRTVIATAERPRVSWKRREFAHRTTGATKRSESLEGAIRSARSLFSSLAEGKKKTKKTESQCVTPGQIL